jgi:hypothetical protein
VRKRRLIIGLAVFVAAAVAWFFAVDWSVFEEECPDCGYGKWVEQYRVFGFPVHERTKEEPALRQRVAADLGVPCEHPGLVRWHKYRLRGLCYRGPPWISGITRLWADDSWYDDSARARLRVMAEANPELGPDFERRVLREHDWDYWHKIVEQIGPKK